MEVEFKRKIAAEFVEMYLTKDPVEAAQYLVNLGVNTVEKARDIAPEIKEEFTRRGYTV